MKVEKARTNEKMLIYSIQKNVLYLQKTACYQFFSAPRPECTTDPECPDHLACIREKCQNPCFTTTCGVNAECRVTRHRAICYCKQGYEGDPYRICEERKQPIR